MGWSMLPAIYVIMLEALVCGLMLNRVLVSKTRRRWHFGAFIGVKTLAASFALYFNGTDYITLLCISISFLYAVICFSDSFVRKLTIVIAGAVCLGLSNLFKFTALSRYNLTQFYNISEDILASVICIAFSMILFATFTIVLTNIVCRVHIKTIALISGIMLFVLAGCAIVYEYMHSLVDIALNGIFSAYALAFMLPAIALLYFAESMVSSGRENLLKY